MIQLGSFYRASRAASRAGALALPVPTVKGTYSKGIGFSELMLLDEGAFERVTALIKGEEYAQAREARGLVG